MLALALLASHLVGDFVFQTRTQAARKLDDARVRAAHCSTYCLAFLPVYLGYGWSRGVASSAFLPALYVLHFLTDSRRFRSTVGDWLAWRFSEEGRSATFRNRARLLCMAAPDAPTGPPPNPWAPIPIVLDQSLHVVQLAALGWLLAS